MVAQEDVRWVQRFQNFCKAFSQLEKFVQKEKLNEMEQQGLIQSFEYNFELSWNLLKDYLEYQGESGLLGSRDCFRLAFQRGLIGDGSLWMQMIRHRALTAHTYNKATADEVSQKVVEEYFPAFKRLKKTFEELLQKEGFA